MKVRREPLIHRQSAASQQTYINPNVHDMPIWERRALFYVVWSYLHLLTTKWLNVRPKRLHSDKITKPVHRWTKSRLLKYRATSTEMRHVLAQLVETLRYKPEGRGFDPRWCHCHNTSGRTMCIGLTQTLRDMIWYDIFVNCNWVVTRWQEYSTHLHTKYT